MVKKKTILELMLAMSEMYEKPLANNKMYLIKKLFNLKMKEGFSVTMHLNEFSSITSHSINYS